jgi:hypothetical protein
MSPRQRKCHASVARDRGDPVIEGQRKVSFWRGGRQGISQDITIKASSAPSCPDSLGRKKKLSKDC